MKQGNADWGRGVGWMKRIAAVVALALAGCGRADVGLPSFSGGADGGALCGDSVCSSDETPSSCPEECKGDCGDGTCDPTETTTSCPSDCQQTKPRCGDGVCGSGETSATCPQDCTKKGCGNGRCEPGETASTCLSDCPGSCGDGI